MKIICNIFILILFAGPAGFAQNKNQDKNPKDRISEDKFIFVNGIDQWVTIKGNPLKPIILFLHGGPGSVMSPYSDHIYKNLENDFTVVQWDQRGAGKTYGKNAPEELTPEFLQANPLTIDQMAADGIALTEYLCKTFKKQKVILFGSSWGSALGVTMAVKRPDLYFAYVGPSQVVNPNDDVTLYKKVSEMALKNNDTLSLKKLSEIGEPPYDRARTVGQLWRIVKKYERQNSVAAPDSWFAEAEAYQNDMDSQHRSEGDDYSFVNFIGDKKLGVNSMRESINFLDTHLEFKIPVYLIQGKEDILTPGKLTSMYFNRLKAPKKMIILLSEAAHGFNQAVVDAQIQIFRNIEVE